MSDQEEKKEEVKEAEKYKILTLGGNLICRFHEFVYMNGNEAKCRKCPAGYVLGPEAVIGEGGKIYLHGEKLML